MHLGFFDSVKAASLNRNILECKSLFLITIIDAVCGLNRNILECKCGTMEQVCESPWVLIETYWNVNAMFSYSKVSQNSLNRNILECKSG